MVRAKKYENAPIFGKVIQRKLLASFFQTRYIFVQKNNTIILGPYIWRMAHITVPVEALACRNPMCQNLEHCNMLNNYAASVIQACT